MKTNLRLLSAVTLVAAGVIAIPLADASENPVANRDAVVEAGNARFTVLTPEMVRIEYSDKACFEDRATFAIINRYLDVPHYTAKEDNEFIYIVTDKFKLKYRKGSDPLTDPASDENLSITIDNGGKEEIWFPGKEDPLNLKGTCRTLDRSDGDNKRSEMEDGILSRSGWAVIDDSWSNKRKDGSRSFAFERSAELGFNWLAERADPEAMDIYFLGYGDNYKKALKDFTSIAGAIPLPPDYVFGYWYSKYASYSTEDYLNIMKDLQDNDVKTDVMILDMDWHWNGNKTSFSEGIGGWTGWSWNTNLIPDPVWLLDSIHNNRMKVALNLHPATGVNSHESPEYFARMNSDLKGRYMIQSGNDLVISWAIDYPDFTETFFKTIIRDHEKEGVDFWWLDWQQHKTSKYTPGLGETFWCNHVFFNDMAVNRPDRRPVIFHRWGGLGSHRYQIGFSGDARINYPTLAFQPYFTATASNVGYGYWGHDLGGHAYTDSVSVKDPELLLRWMQFGVFTPIFRTHATNNDAIERRIWKYDNFPLLKATVDLRYAIFPYLYTMARKTYDTGVSICRPLYYEHPKNEESYLYENEYYFGDDILVAPITEHSNGNTSNKEVWLPEGEWWSVAHSSFFAGSKLVTLEYGQEDIPYFFRKGAIIPYNPPSVKNVTERSSHLILNIVSGVDGFGSLYEDQGDNPDYETSFATTEFSQKYDGNAGEYIIYPRHGDSKGLPENRSYTLRILGASSPASVQVNGIVANKETFSYDHQSESLTIDLPSLPCNQKTVVGVIYE